MKSYRAIVHSRCWSFRSDPGAKTTTARPRSCSAWAGTCRWLPDTTEKVTSSPNWSELTLVRKKTCGANLLMCFALKTFKKCWIILFSASLPSRYRVQNQRSVQSWLHPQLGGATGLLVSYTAMLLQMFFQLYIFKESFSAWQLYHWDMSLLTPGHGKPEELETILFL